MRRGVGLLEESLRLGAPRPDALYQLSLAYALLNDPTSARAAAGRLAQLAPNYPGLAQWRQLLDGANAGPPR